MGNSVSRDLIGDVVFEDDQIAVCENGIEIKWCVLVQIRLKLFINILQSFLV
jgi:hypothetical protein